MQSLKKQEKAVYIQRVQTSEEFHSLQEKWNTLLAESPADNFFLRWGWLRAWWKVYKENNYKLCILLVFKENKQLIGIAPFYVIKQTWKNIFTIRRLMFLGTKEGNVISEYMDIIYRTGYEEIVIRKIMEYIVQEKICDDICLHKIETPSKTTLLFQQMAQKMRFLHIVKEKLECPYISLPSDYEDFLISLSSSMRYKIRREQRRLMKNHKAIFRKTDSISELETDFNELVRLHQLRWKTRRLPGSFSREKFYLFQKLVMHDMLKNGYLELTFLSVSGRNIAVLYNIRYKDKIYFYQGGLDVSFDSNLSPGLLLHSHCIEEAIRDGLKEYDFLLMGKMDSYKKQWTKGYRYLCDIYIARPGIMKFMISAKNKARAYYHAINRF